jgi:hypothetical protein
MPGPCHAEPNNLQGFKDALLRHDVARQAFRTKFSTGYYATPGKLNQELSRTKPEELIQIASRLQNGRPHILRNHRANQRRPYYECTTENRIWTR